MFHYFKQHVRNLKSGKQFKTRFVWSRRALNPFRYRSFLKFQNHPLYSTADVTYSMYVTYVHNMIFYGSHFLYFPQKTIGKYHSTKAIVSILKKQKHLEWIGYYCTVHSWNKKIKTIYSGESTRMYTFK